jgi:pyrroline-5-carboxylate reductase
MDNKKIVMIGAGNVATHISEAFHNEGYEIVQIFSKTMRSAVELASKFECGFTTEIKEITPEADIYFVCVSDRAIRTVLISLPVRDKLVIHTAGSVDINIFRRLQT